MADPYNLPPSPFLIQVDPQKPKQLQGPQLQIGGPIEMVPMDQLKGAPQPSALPTLTGPINLSGGGSDLQMARDVQQAQPVQSGSADLRPLFAQQAQQQASAPVAPGAVLTGTGGGQPAAQGQAAPGNPFLSPYLNLIDAQKAELLRPQPQGRMVRPPAPEPLLRMGRLQNEAGNIDQALARGERDIAYRRADNGVDLANERTRMVNEEAKLIEDREAQLKPIRDQLAQIQQQVQQGQVDPDRLWNKASTGERAGFLVGAIMAGVGQSIAGRGGQQNAAMQSLFTLMDRDNNAQILEQQSRGQKANDLAQLYKQTLDITGNKQAAVHAANIAKLDAMAQQFEAEYENLRAKMPIGVQKRDPVTGQPIQAETTILDQRLASAQNAIQQRRAREDLLLQQQIAAATKPIGGGGGNSRLKTLQQLTGLTKAQMDAQAEANKAAKDAGKDDPHAIFVNGQKYQIDPNAPKEAAFEAQKKINMAEQGLKSIDSMEKRLASAPAAGYLEKGARLIGAERLANAFADEGRLLSTDQVTGLMSQLSGAGVPSETQARLYQQILAGGPGAQAALGEARRVLNQGKEITIKNLGVR